MQECLLFKRTHPLASPPTRATPGSAGYDLSACSSINIPPRGRALVPTGLILQIPAGHVGRILPRSSLALKNGIDVGAGVIDCDYRGEVGIVLFNHSDADVLIMQGQRCAQLVLERISVPDAIEVKELSNTQRGTGGFGSTNATTNAANAA